LGFAFAAAIGWRWWALTGLCFGIATAIIWGRPFSLGGALLAAPLMAVGAYVAQRMWRVVERPTRRGVLTFVALAGVAAPAFTDIVDLALRAHTPQARSPHVPPRGRGHGAGGDPRGRSGISRDRLVAHGSTLVRQQAAPLRSLDP
jgi:uncharacterized membrane protein YgcG